MHSHDLAVGPARKQRAGKQHTHRGLVASLSIVDLMTPLVLQSLLFLKSDKLNFAYCSFTRHNAFHSPVGQSHLHRSDWITAAEGRSEAYHLSSSHARVL